MAEAELNCQVSGRARVPCAHESSVQAVSNSPVAAHTDARIRPPADAGRIGRS